MGKEIEAESFIENGIKNENELKIKRRKIVWNFYFLERKFVLFLNFNKIFINNHVKNNFLRVSYNNFWNLKVPDFKRNL